MSSNTPQLSVRITADARDGGVRPVVAILDLRHGPAWRERPFERAA